MQKITFLLAATFALTACEAPKTPVPTGGSRSDALVELSYDVGPYEQAVVDWDTAQASAVKRCRAWGYSKADPFEGVREQCQQFNGYGSCMRGTVTRTYQCTN
ncbi:YecR-like lipoprotein [Roseovarius marisflavi]|uniref:YecR-like lipoprotein n=1 Tax=Roseovarius marisflavi TaxID=1054996 RepID=A0A1M7DAX3_9RHOB|nr:YecR-like lipoprotein [Roseovarius marisflavi]